MILRHTLLPLALGAAVAALPARAQNIGAQDAATAAAIEPRDTSDALMALAEAQAGQIGTDIDAAIAQNITALGAYTGLSVDHWAPLALTTRPQVPNAYSQGNGHMLPDPGLTLADLTHRQFGSNRVMAVRLEQRLVDSRNMAANVRLHHASGPLDLRVDFKGNKALDAASEMRLSYDSAAVYNLNRALALGVKARGNLGTFDRFAPHAEHDAGAFARLNLLGKGGALSAETGYDVKVGPDAPPSQGQVRANVNLKLKL